MQTSTSKIKIVAIVLITIIAVKMFTPKQTGNSYQPTPTCAAPVASNVNDISEPANQAGAANQAVVTDEEAAAALLLLAAIAQESDGNTAGSYSESDYNDNSNYDENGLKTSYTSADIHDIVSTQVGESIVYE